MSEQETTRTAHDTDAHYCKRCGEQYAWEEVEAPENPSIYWVPHCPACNAKCTATTVDLLWLNICGGSLDKRDDHYERQREKLHYQARMYHGRLSGLSVDELVDRAQWFDERVTHGRRWGPEHDRDVAFALRKQAREKVL